MSAPSAPARVVRERARLSLGSRLLFFALLLAILGIYLLPSALACHANGATLPPLFAADLSLYLNLSNLQAAGPGALVNPWYGTTVSAAAMVYRKFGLSFFAFHLLWLASGKSWYGSVLLWNLGWTVGIGLSGLRLVRRLAPRSVWLAASGLALLMLVDLHFLPAIPSAWLHLPRLGRFADFSLPFIRSFFPQVSIPLLLLYLDRLMDALERNARRPWLVMAVLQAVAFALYPYATLLMAGTTALALGLTFSGARPLARPSVVAVFVMACGLLDIGYLLAVGTPAAAGGASRTALFHLDPGLLVHLLLSKTLFLVVLLTLAVGAAGGEKDRRSVRTVLASLGAAAALMLLADTVLSPGLQIAHHTLFLLQPVLALLLVAIFDRLSVGRDARLVRWAGIGAVGFFVAHGILTAGGTFAGMAPINSSNAAEAAAIQRAGLTPRDLVLARAEIVDDAAAWVPLVSPARVLFCRNAEFVQAPEQGERVQLPRQALYLYFTGRDAAWVDRVLSPATPVMEQNFLAPTQSRLLLEGPGRAQALADLRGRLDPLLWKMAARDPDAEALLRSYDRVLVVDSIARPSFSAERLERYLQLERETRAGEVSLRWYRSRPEAALH